MKEKVNACKSPKDAENLWTELVKQIWESFLRYMINIFKDYEKYLTPENPDL